MATFEESIDKIDIEIYKRKSKWNLRALPWMDFDDVAQLIRVHVNKQWERYDQSRPIGPWINTVISNRIKNIIRDVYLNHARPCLRCAASEGDDLCSIYTKQCGDCPIYARWLKNKKGAHDVKLPVSLENHTQEVSEIPNEDLDIEATAENLHVRMQGVLAQNEWIIYKFLYIDHNSEDRLAAHLGINENEKGRQVYKDMKETHKVVLGKVRAMVYSGEVDFK